jgi:DNA polymerase I
LNLRLAFDCETDGLLDELTKLHCLAITDLDTGEQMDFADQPGFRPIVEGIALLSRAKLLVGHNIIDFDIPAIKKVYPNWTYRGLVRDTIVLARLMWPHITDKDFRLCCVRGKLRATPAEVFAEPCDVRACIDRLRNGSF